MSETWQELVEARRLKEAIEDEFVLALRLIGREAARSRPRQGRDRGDERPPRA